MSLFWKLTKTVVDIISEGNDFEAFGDEYYLMFFSIF